MTTGHAKPEKDLTGWAHITSHVVTTPEKRKPAVCTQSIAPKRKPPGLFRTPAADSAIENSDLEYYCALSFCIAFAVVGLFSVPLAGAGPAFD